MGLVGLSNVTVDTWPAGAGSPDRGRAGRVVALEPRRRARAPPLRALGRGDRRLGPLGNGFLAGDVALADDDFRNAPCFQGDNLERNSDRFAPLRRIAEEAGVPRAAGARLAAGARRARRSDPRQPDAGATSTRTSLRWRCGWTRRRSRVDEASASDDRAAERSCRRRAPADPGAIPERVRRGEGRARGGDGFEGSSVFVTGGVGSSSARRSCRPRNPAQGPRAGGVAAEGRPLPQRGLGTMSLLQTARSCYRGRRRDRPGPGALRALHRREPLPHLQRHDGAVYDAVIKKERLATSSAPRCR